MHDPISIFLIFFGVISITVVLFVFWIIAGVFRFVGRGLSSLFRIPDPPHAALPAASRCARRGCQAINPTTARFCRRCGRELEHAERERRAAIW